MIKSKIEIENIRAASRLTDECFSSICSEIKPGVTEKEVAEKIEAFIIKNGAELAFPVIAAFGKNTSFVHHLKASMYVKCRRQEIILLDFGAKVNGYCSDMTRMVFVGKPKKEWIFAYKTILHVQQTILDAIRPSPFSGAKMDILARQMIADAGLPPYPHGLGHSLGIEIHEHPKLNRKKDAVIAPVAVFTVEPGTYIKGQYGIRIEDTVCLKSNGLERLTTSTKEMIIV
jgi:Xaa-Pro aminopeptidase